VSPNSYSFGAGRLLAGVVAPEAALAERAEQIAQGAVAEEVERLVGHLEGHGRLIGPVAAGASLTPLALGFEIRRRRDVAFLRHPLDDLLDQLFELRARIALIGVGRIAKQPLDRLLGQNAAVEQGVEDRIVERLHRALVIVAAVRIAEPAGEQQVGQLGDQIFQIEVVELVARVFRVPVLHRFLIPDFNS